MTTRRRFVSGLAACGATAFAGRPAESWAESFAGVLAESSAKSSAKSSPRPPAEADARLRTLIVSYNEDYAPYSWSDKGGDVMGILPDVLTPLLSGMPDLAVRNAAYPWRRAQAVLQTTEADAICTFASEERKAYASFNRIPVAVLRPELFFAARNPRRSELDRVNSREGLRAFALVDQQGNQWAEQALAAYPNIQWVGGHDSIFRMVLNGRADVHVSLSPIVTRWRLQKLGIRDGVVSRPAPFIAAEVPFHLGIRKTHPRAERILQALDKQLASAAYQKQLDKVLARYL